MVALTSKEPILFYDEVGIFDYDVGWINIYISCSSSFLVLCVTHDNIVFLVLQVVLYEDELADNGVSLLTVKVVSLEPAASCCYNRFDMLSIH